LIATGSNAARTPLYSLGISNNLEELKQDFLIYVIRKDEVFEECIAGGNYIVF